MAWNSLYRWFAVFRKSPYVDMVYWYSEYYLKTPEQREKEREARKRETKQALENIGVMCAAVSRHCGNSYGLEKSYGDFCRLIRKTNLLDD